MSSWQLFLKAWELKFLNQINFLADSSFNVFSKIPGVFNQEVILIHDSNWPCIRVNILHTLNIMNRNEVSSLIIVRCWCCYFTPLCRSNLGNVNFREILSWMIHFPLFTEIINYETIESHLCSIKHNCFGLFLGTNKLINTNDPSQIPNVTKDHNIILKTVFFSDLCVSFIHVYLIVEFVAHLD